MYTCVIIVYTAISALLCMKPPLLSLEEKKRRNLTLQANATKTLIQKAKLCTFCSQSLRILNSMVS